MAENRSINEVGIPTNAAKANAERSQRLNRMWLSANLAVAFVLAVCFYIKVIDHDARLGPLSGEYLMTLSFATAIWSVVATLFVVGIPSRLAMNMIIKARRRPYRQETIALVVTFAALAWMFYILWKVPMEG